MYSDCLRTTKKEREGEGDRTRRGRAGDYDGMDGGIEPGVCLDHPPSTTFDCPVMLAGGNTSVITRTSQNLVEFLTSRGGSWMWEGD